MVDINLLAIADLLVHPELGTVSYQPDLSEPITNIIPVRDRKGKLYFVQASDCSVANDWQRIGYWKDFSKHLKEID